MTKVFKGRPVVPGAVQAEALVSQSGFNTLASYCLLYTSRCV